MKNMLCAILALVLLMSVVSGCADKQDELYSRVMGEFPSSSVAISENVVNPVPEESSEVETSQTENRFDPAVNYLTKRPKGSELFDIEPNTELSGTLTISVTISNESLSRWIEAFEAAYPNVDVVLKSGFNSYEAAAKAEKVGGGLSAATQQTIVDLFAGEAGDIVNLNAAPYQRFAQSGLFRDLYEFMDSDSDFHREDYYTNLFQGWETADGKLPVIGPSVYPTSLAFNKLVLDEMGIDLQKEYPNGLNYQDIADVYYRAKDSGALSEVAVLGKYVGTNSFDPFETVNYFDEQKSECWFDAPEYVEYLETMKDIADGPVGYKASINPFTDHSELLQIGSLVFETLDELQGKWDGANKVYQTYRVQDGGNLFRGVDIYGITSSCKNPELAWEFLKFMVSEKDFPEKLNLFGEYDEVYRQQYSGYLPIHRGTLKNLCSSYYGNESVFQVADDIMKTLSVQEYREGELYMALFDIYMNYYEYDLIDAQECAKQLQERAWLYFNE